MSILNQQDIILVGVPALDDQHQQLVKIVNDMYQQITTCRTLDEERIITERFLEQFEQYASLHFATEEAFLVKMNFPDTVQHQSEHKHFIKEMQRIRDSHAAGELALSFDVFSSARDWIANHINVSDQKYALYLKE